MASPLAPAVPLSCFDCEHEYAVHFARGIRTGTYAAVRGEERVVVDSLTATGEIRCRLCRDRRHHRLSTSVA